MTFVTINNSSNGVRSINKGSGPYMKDNQCITVKGIIRSLLNCSMSIDRDKFCPPFPSLC